MNIVWHASGLTRQSSIIVPVDGGVRSIDWTKAFMPATTLSLASCSAVSAWPGWLPAKWFRKLNSTVAPELDWVGLVAHTVALRLSTDAITCAAVTSLPPSPSFVMTGLKPA